MILDIGGGFGFYIPNRAVTTEVMHAILLGRAAIKNWKDQTWVASPDKFLIDPRSQLKEPSNGEASDD